MPGPLQGYKVIELAGIGPAPFAAMVLADMGADVVRVDRSAAVRDDPGATPSRDVVNRGRRSVGVDLKHPDGCAAVLALVEQADALVEGFRPGVTERLGVGPDVCLARNPRLVYGRMTGWGQDGPLASVAGHDINYISLAGVLGHIGRAGEAPVPPLNLVGDYGGGGMLLAFGVVCGLLEARRSGQGQVVDAAMVDGAALLMTFIHGLAASGVHDEHHRGASLLDTGAHFYDVYECADGQFISIGSIESQFYAELLQRLGLDGELDVAEQMDRAQWPALKPRFRELFASKTRDEWCALLEGTDACFAPVLTMAEAAAHPHNVHRGTFQSPGGIRQPGPAPRFSRTAPELGQLPAHPGQHTREVLSDWGVDGATVNKWLEAGAIK